MNTYRLTSMEEPTDEMLATLMKEVAEEAKRKGQVATDKFLSVWMKQLPCVKKSGL